MILTGDNIFARTDYESVTSLEISGKYLKLEINVEDYYLGSVWVQTGEKFYIETIGGKLEESDFIGYGYKDEHITTTSGYLHKVKELHVEEGTNMVIVKVICKGGID